MRKIVLAAGLFAALGVVAATGVARADDFSGVGQHPKALAISGDAAPAASEMLPPAARDPVQQVHTVGAFNPFDTSTRSHGHP